jgi:hypothetical protein
MKKILLALTILSLGASAFHIRRLANGHLQDEAGTLRQALMLETEQLATIQAEGAGLTERVGDLRRTLAATKAAPENGLWSALQTNRADHLPENLQNRLWDEFSFSWQTLQDSIVVSKQTMRNLRLRVLQPDGNLNNVAAATLAITPEEHAGLEAAIEQAKTDFKSWVLAHVQREEPGGDVVAHYSLPGDATTAGNLTTNFFLAVAQAVGQQRKELIRDTAVTWMQEMGVSEHSTRLTIRREMVGDEARLKAELRELGRTRSAYLPLAGRDFPKALLSLFPNRWTDLAQREGFEMPKASQKK